MDSLHQELKAFVIETMNLEDISIDDISDDAPLFGDTGLGLDSIDALELVLALKKKYQVVIEASNPESLKSLASISALAELIRRQPA